MLLTPGVKQFKTPQQGHGIHQTQSVQQAQVKCVWGPAVSDRLSSDKEAIKRLALVMTKAKADVLSSTEAVEEDESGVKFECPYCQELVGDLADHCMEKHGSEDEV